MIQVEEKDAHNISYGVEFFLTKPFHHLFGIVGKIDNLDRASLFNERITEKPAIEKPSMHEHKIRISPHSCIL